MERDLEYEGWLDILNNQWQNILSSDNVHPMWPVIVDKIAEQVANEGITDLEL
jgi:hypothetical protein